MAATYRLITGSLDLSAVARYVRRVDVTENAGTPAAARVLLRNGGLSGDIVVDIRIAASDSRHISFNPPLFLPDGCYLQVSAGTVRGSIDAD